MKDFTAAHGMYPVLITPFDESKQIDWSAYEQLIEWHIGKGVHGVFAVCGSSEYFELTEEEALKLARTAVTVSAGRVHVLAGSNFHPTLEQNIALTKRMAETGIQGCFITTPPPDRVPPEDGPMLDYYYAIHDAVDFPLYAYEQPVTPYKFSYDAVSRLAEGRNFIGMKDTSTDDSWTDAKAREHVSKKVAATGGNYQILPASSAHLLTSLELGCTGGMTIAANVAPSLYAKLYRLFKAGDMATARKLQERITRVDQMIGWGYMRSAKIALGMMGLPVTPVTRIKSREFDDTRLAAVREMVEFVEQTEEEFDALK